MPDHLGWHEQGDGLLYVGIPVASGRIVDGAGSRIRTALREIVGRFRCDPILMPSQDIILSEIRPRIGTRSLRSCASIACASAKTCAGRALGARLPGLADLLA